MHLFSLLWTLRFVIQSSDEKTVSLSVIWHFLSVFGQMMIKERASFNDDFRNNLQTNRKVKWVYKKVENCEDLACNAYSFRRNSYLDSGWVSRFVLADFEFQKPSFTETIAVSVALVLIAIYVYVSFFIYSGVFGSPIPQNSDVYADPLCPGNIKNLWLDVVVVVDKSQLMTNSQLWQVCFNCNGL